MGGKSFRGSARATQIMFTCLVAFIFLAFTGSVQAIFAGDMDISDQVQVNIGRPYYDFGAKQTYTAITLTNVGDHSIPEPVKLVITSISVAGVVVANADGSTNEGLPYLDYSAALGDTALEPGETSSVQVLRFDNPSRLRFAFTTQVRTKQVVFNQPPVANAGPDQQHTVLPGQTMEVNLDASGSADPDGDAIAGYVWTGTPDPADNVQPTVTLGSGSHEFTLMVTDAHGAESVPDTVTITVTELSPPQISVSPTTYSVNEGGNLEISLTSSDPEGQEVTLTTTALPNNASFISTPSVNPTGLLLFAPEFNQAGVYTITVMATDPDGLTDTVELGITVVNFNRPPQADTLQINTRENTPAAITLTGSDPDEDTLTFTILAPPFHGVIEGTPPELMYTPDSGYLGDDSFEFQVADGSGAMATAMVGISVSTNRPPQITSMPWTRAVVDVEYNYPVTATDPDGDILIYRLTAAPDTMEIDANGLIHWTPASTQPTDVAVAVEVVDGFGGQDTQTYWIRLSQEDSPTANTKPIASAGDDYVVKEGNQDALDGTHSYDAEGDHLRYHWVQTGGPTVTLDNVYSATPSYVAPEVETNTLLAFNLTVSDGSEISDVDTVNVMVLNTTLPPEGNGVVTNSNLEGAGSLKAALTYANDHPGTHITFNIPESDPGYGKYTPGVWTLPSPTMYGKYYWFGGSYGGGPIIEGDGTFVDGLSQTENQGDRNPYGPEIEIDFSTSYRYLYVFASNAVIQGLVLNDRSTRVANDGMITINNGANNLIIGNYIGTDATGSQPLCRRLNASPAISAPGMDYNENEDYSDAEYQITNLRIGGAKPGEGNLIFSETVTLYLVNGNAGIPKSYINVSITVQGNLIGTDRTGTINMVEQVAPITSPEEYPRGQTGIYIGKSSQEPGVCKRDVQIGGISPGSRNVIAGYENNILIVRDAGRIDILGNYIGTDISGSADLNHGLSHYGIRVMEIYSKYKPAPVPETDENTIFIGDGIPGAGNVISGSITGVEQWAYDVQTAPLIIQGNFVGTGADGVTSIANRDYGLYLYSRPTYVVPIVGGHNPGEGNVIGGSAISGIYTDGRAYIKGNRIGVAADGVTPLPNGDGIFLGGWSTWSQIGGYDAGEHNDISNNSGIGINIKGTYTIDGVYHPTWAMILGNSIHDNGGVGIRKERNAFTVRANQEFPVIQGAETSGGATRVWGTLSSIKPQNCLIELFVNHQPDTGGYGEGESWVGALYPAADGKFETLIPETLSGLYMTATATRMVMDENDPYSTNTSEFALARLVGETPSINLPPEILSSPVVTATTESAYLYQLNASDPESSPLQYTLALAPAGMTIDMEGNIEWTPTSAQEGRATVTVVVLDDAGLFASQNFKIQVLPLVDTEPPVISAVVPTGTVSYPSQLAGTINDPYLVWYGIEIAPQGSNQWHLIQEGTTSVVGGTLTTIDPSKLGNGLYDVRFSAYDEGGRLTVLNGSSPLEIGGSLKIGQFSLAFQDIGVPLVGIPITVQRVYNSFNKQKGDFGVGWDMSLYSGIKVQVTRTLGTGFYTEQSGDILGTPTYTLRTDNAPRVLITYANGKQERFEFTPHLTSPLDQNVVTPQFTALSGTTSSLSVPGEGDLPYDYGMILDDAGGEVTAYNPDQFQITTADGTSFVISRSSGLQRIVDRNGNTLTFTPEGITHSSGATIAFQRDASQRIERITNLNGDFVNYSYDDKGDLVRFTDLVGNETQFIYDDDHNLIRIIDPRGINVLAAEYDGDGRINATVDALGNRTLMEHDLDATIERITDRNGHTTEYYYDENGNITAMVDPLGNRTQYTYDATGNMLSETDPQGNTSSWTYDEKGNRLSQTDPLGNISHWYYNSLQEVTRLIDPLGHEISITYDPAGNTTGLVEPDGSTFNITNNGSGQPTEVKLPNGATTMNQYGPDGHLIASDLHSQNGSLVRHTTYTYDNNGNKTSETVERTLESGTTEQITTTFQYDNANRLIQVIDASGSESSIAYNAMGKKSSETNVLSQTTEYDYDELGNLTQITFPDGKEETRGYDAESNLLWFTDRGGNTTNYQYDEKNRLTATILPDGSTIRSEYGSCCGQVLTQIDAMGNTTDYSYDETGKVQRITLPEVYDAVLKERRRPQIVYEYDAAGRVSALVNDYGERLEYQYDDAGHLVGIKYPDGSTESREFSGGNLITKTNTAGMMTRYRYDAQDNVTAIEVTRPDNTDLYTAMVFTYDQSRNKLSQTDALGRTTRYAYDKLGRRTGVTLPDGSQNKYQYDALGKVTAYTDFNGSTATYDYDQMNRLVAKHLPSGGVVALSYNDNGLRSESIDGRGTTSYVYDNRNRLIQVDGPEGTLSYEYDANGNRIRITSPSGSTSYSYDAANRLTDVQDEDELPTEYGYDTLGRLAYSILPSDISTTYQYDTLGRLHKIDILGRNSELLGSYLYERDTSGQITHVLEGDGDTVNYEYDNLGRLLHESRSGAHPIDKRYTYNLVGNRLSQLADGQLTTYSYDVNDRLISAGFTGFVYDANGNMLEQLGIDTTEYFTYDDENRLAAYNANGEAVTYSYDIDGNRVGKTTASDVYSYLVDSISPTGIPQVIEMNSQNDSLVTRYAYGRKRLSSYSGAQRRDYLYDGQRNVRILANQTGELSDSYTYTAFGELVGTSGESDNQFLFAGQQYDEKSGRYFMRARYYQPQVGRFISRDPLSGNSASAVVWHPYVYALNNPVNRWDPSGLFSLQELSITNCIHNSLSALRWAGTLCKNKQVAEELLEATGLKSILSNAFSSPALSIGSGSWTIPEGGSQGSNTGVSIFNFSWKSPIERTSGLKEFGISAKWQDDNHLWLNVAGKIKENEDSLSLPISVQGPIVPWDFDYFRSKWSLGTEFKKDFPVIKGCADTVLATLGVGFSAVTGSSTKANIEVSAIFVGLLEIKQTVVEVAPDYIWWFPPWNQEDFRITLN